MLFLRWNCVIYLRKHTCLKRSKDICRRNQYCLLFKKSDRQNKSYIFPALSLQESSCQKQGIRISLQCYWKNFRIKNSCIEISSPEICSEKTPESQPATSQVRWLLYRQSWSSTRTGVPWHRHQRNVEINRDMMQSQDMYIVSYFWHAHIHAYSICF